MINRKIGFLKPAITHIQTSILRVVIIDKSSAYGEPYGNFPANNRANHSGDAGITYLIKHNFQLDATVGSGFSGNQDLL